MKLNRMNMIVRIKSMMRMNSVIIKIRGRLFRRYDSGQLTAGKQKCCTKLAAPMPVPGPLMVAIPALCLLMIIPGCAFGQSSPLNLTGGISMSGRAYQASGIDGRRAPLSANTNANLQFNLFGLQSGLNLTYTTEESRLRQSVNRLSFDMGWSWGRVSAGDVSPDLGRYALQGSTVRGGYVEANHSNVFAAFTAGQSKKAVGFSEDAPFRPASFQRMMYAGRVGYGDQRATFFALGGMYGRDVAGSIDAPGTATPADNLVLTFEGGLHLFERMLQLKGQLSSSALNRDIRNPASDDPAIPGYMSAFIRAREGSSHNMAGEGEVRFQIPSFSLVTRYSRIQPGYESLGVQNIMNDQENVSVQPAFNLFNQRLMVSMDMQYSRNNLDNQLQSTLSRNKVGLNITGRISEGLMVTGSYNRMGNLNKPATDFSDPAALQLDFLMQTLMLTPTLMINGGGLSHAVTLSGAYQFSNDRSLAVRQGLRRGRDLDVYMATFSYMLRFPSGFSVNTTGNWVQSDAPGTSNTTLGANAGTVFTFLENRLNMNVNVGWSENTSEFALAGISTVRKTQQLIGTLGANYRLTGKTSLRLQTRAMSNRQIDGVGPAFQELQSEIFISHRF